MSMRSSDGCFQKAYLESAELHDVMRMTRYGDTDHACPTRGVDGDGADLHRMMPDRRCKVHWRRTHLVQSERVTDIIPGSRDFHDPERAQLLGLLERIARFLDDLVGQILVGVMTLGINRGVKTLLSQLDRFIDTIERAVRIRSEGWIVAFRHGIYPLSEGREPGSIQNGSENFTLPQPLIAARAKRKFSLAHLWSQDHFRELLSESLKRKKQIA